MLRIKANTDKFVDTIDDFVCIRIVDGRPFLCHGIPIFQLIIFTPSKSGIQILSCSDPFQDIISTEKLYI